MKWKPVESIPDEGEFLVWLEKPHKLRQSNIGLMRKLINVSLIDGMFAFDVPAVKYWAHIKELPTPPEFWGKEDAS